jgi:cytoskeletal protein CcmA (bactofilin family)
LTGRLSGKSRFRPENAHIHTLIGAGTQVQGALNFRGGLHVDGQVDGHVSAEDVPGEAVLRIGRSGSIAGDVNVPYVLVEGCIRGRVYARCGLWVMTTGRIDGDVFYHVMTIEQGGVINGMAHRMDEGAEFPAQPDQPFLLEK